MNSLTAQRCFRHPLREAVAACAGCAHFFCRECVVEHDDRMWCADCLRRLTRSDEARARRGWRHVATPLAQAALLGAGVLIAWQFFYWIGKLLLLLPDSFHNGTMWGDS